MPDFDLLIRGAGNFPAIAIAEGRIVAFEEGVAREVIDAHGLLVLPGAIDAHVHFNEPGRTNWEGFATGSAACVAGGTTTFFDMPLNSTPPIVDADSFFQKRLAAERQSRADFALWGGLVPGNLPHLEPLRECGVIGLKAFMSNTGIDDFQHSDTETLRVGMKEAARLGLIVAVHAEIDHPDLKQGTTARDFMASRPIDIELEAIRIALDLAGETGCSLHVVHVSSAAGVGLIAEARAAGRDVTCEVCPHHLRLTDDDMERLGAVAKCAPPLRPEAERAALLARVVAGDVTTIGSDHSPSPADLKTGDDFFQVWGGIAGCQHLLALLFDLGLDADLIARLTAEQVASRFRLEPQKGRVAIGADADLVLVDPKGRTVVTAETLRYRHRLTPYLGMALRGAVTRTLLRGQTVALAGQPFGMPSGRFLSLEIAG